MMHGLTNFNSCVLVKLEFIPLTKVASCIVRNVWCSWHRRTKSWQGDVWN